VREDLRKPYVIGNYMLTSGIRVGAGDDAYSLETLNRTGVLQAAAWTRLPHDLASHPQPAQEIARGGEVFRLECSSCHSVDGYLAIRPLVSGAAPEALHGMLGRLDTWRGRRMPPFVGTADERRAVAVYLASLGGATPDALTGFGAEAELGPKLFGENCAMCHGTDADFPFDAQGRRADVFYEMLGRLPAVNEAMPPFEGSEAERRALAEHLATLGRAAKGGAQ
jgi:mono/diheme cytochrome c family protein